MNPAEEMPSHLESVSWGSLAVSKLKFVGRRLCRATRPFDYGRGRFGHPLALLPTKQKCQQIPNQRQLEQDQGKTEAKIWRSFTDDDLMFVEGKEDELFGRLQQRLGKTNEEIRREIEES